MLSATSGGHLEGQKGKREQSTAGKNQLTDSSDETAEDGAGREASRRRATAFIAPPGTPPSLPGWEGSKADPAPIRTSAGEGGAEILGAAQAPPDRPAPALPRGLVWVRKSKINPRGWMGTVWSRRIPRDKGWGPRPTAAGTGRRRRCGVRCHARWFWQHPQGYLEPHEPERGLSVALSCWGLGEGFFFWF